MKQNSKRRVDGMRKQLEEEKEGIERMIRETDVISKTMEQSIDRPSMFDRDSEIQRGGQEIG